MSNRTSENVDNAEVVSHAQSPADAWKGHRRAAVLEFLKNVVVIDNEPTVDHGASQAVELEEPPKAVSLKAGEEEESKYKKVKRPDHTDDLPEESHPLDVRMVSDAFAEHGIACAFVLPADNDVDEGAEDRIKSRTLKAARFADLVVIDWHLRGSTPNLTLEILTEIAKEDVAERGRMRLICIYTGQDVDGGGAGRGILQGAMDALAAGGIIVNPVSGEARVAKSVDCLLVVMSKNDHKPNYLPIALVDVFTHLADGLLPSFALAAVGAIRKNVHHMMTRFSGALDAAYVANRMISDPPGDVAELIRELFVAECDNALGLESVADRFLNIEGILTWMDVQGVPSQERSYKYTKRETGKEEVVTINMDRAFLDALIKFGVSDGDMYLDNGGNRQPFKEDRRQLVSKALSTNDAFAKKAEEDFARLVILRREAFGSTKLSDRSSWRPSLTTGTLVKVVGEPYLGSSYFICLTPACDTLRLDGKERFVFMGNVSTDKKVNLVVAEEGGKNTNLFFPHDRPNLATFEFSPDNTTKRVLAAQEGDGQNVKYHFTAATGAAKFQWLGEVRYARATGDVAKVVGNWMRIGVNDSEFLRLAAKGKAKF